MGLRKPILFTVVFGVGLTVLWFVVEPAERESRPVPRIARTPEIKERAPDAEQDALSVEFGGSLEYTQFAAEARGGRRPKLFHFLAAHVEHLGDEEYRVENLFVELFGQESEAGDVPLRATLRSPESRMPIHFRDNRREFGAEDTVTLTAVDAQVYDGIPLVPARIETQELTVSLANARYSTPGFVDFNGSGARATGREFSLDQRAGLLRFGRDGEITFFSAEIPASTLAATGRGTLSIERSSAGAGGEVRVLVDDGARLETSAETSAETGVSATANRIEFTGTSGGEGSFSATSALASGGVVIDGGGGRFAGERALFLFDEKGQLQETRLQGGPTARLPIAVEGGDVVWVALEATESVHLLTEAGFSVRGPCTVRVPDRDFTLECDGQLLGTGQPREGFGWLSASGGVRATLGAQEFVGDDLELRSFTSSTGAVEWTMQTTGAAQLTNTAAEGDGASYRAQIGSDLELATSGMELHIRHATDVDVTVEGAGAFLLLAGELRNASLAERLFQASGGVRFSDRQLTGEALEASAEPGGVLALTGSVTEPVKLDFTQTGLLQQGEVRAHHVRVSPGEINATGSVRAELEGGAGALDFEAAVLEASFIADESGAPLPGPVVLSLRDVERCRLLSSGELISWSADTTVLSLLALGPPEDEEEEEEEEEEGQGEGGGGLELRAALASGGVLIERQVEGELFAASGERLEVLPGAGTSLIGADGSFVRLSGVFPGGDRYGRVIAREVRFVDRHMTARDATIAYEGGEEAPIIVRTISADWIDAAEERVQLSGGVHIEGDSPQTGGWTLKSTNAHLDNDGSMVAWDGFEWTSADGSRATGNILQATSDGISMEGEPAVLRFAGLEWEANNIHLDRERMLLTAGKGRVRASDDESIELTYDSIQPVEGPDATILGLRRPRFVRGNTMARAEWALLWVDQNEGGARTAPTGDAPSLFGRVNARGFSSALDEIYIEGRVEVFEGDRRRAEVDAVYLDLVDGRGWLKSARLIVPVEVSGELTELAIDAEWLRHSADGSLTANSARITTCDHVDPHYFIRTKDLRLKPSAEEGVRWDIDVRSNALVFVGGLTIPLPAIEYEADKEGNPLIDRLVLGDTARFGTVLQATVDGELGVVERVASAITGADPEDISGGLRYRASWLGERGLMLGIGAEIEAEEEFWFHLYADGLEDSSTDRGVLRVDVDDRGSFRGLTRARGRANIDEGEWIDFAFSEQSDAGVQAEFFEREFLHYEERENYLHWRQADGEDFAAVRLQVRAGDFRNEVEQLPSLAYSHGRAPLFDVDGHEVLYMASADFGSYTRREGEGGTISPFDPFFETSLGTRQLLRFDTRHRLELPVRFAGGGAQATPFLQLVGTSWSEGIDPADSPRRGAVSAGVELSTTLWRRSEAGSTHTLAPFISISGDIWSDAGEGDLIPLDSIEDPLPGDHIDLGVYSRWKNTETHESIDLSLFGRYARDTETVLPLEVLTEYLGDVGGLPFALQHDALYDLEAGETIYSRSAAGVQIYEDLVWEMGFHQGKDTARTDLFEAASVSTRWRVSPKWEVEARQTVSLLDSDELGSRLTLRRYGHDLILDVEFSERSGEGGSSVSFSLSPMVGWRRDRLGQLDHWLTTRR